MTDLTVGIALFAGIASFFSPCVFSLVPAYVSYLSGSSAGNENAKAGYSLKQGVFFILGFTVIFVLLGSIFAGLGAISYNITQWLTRIGGLVVILFGLHTMHIITIPFLNFDTRYHGKMNKSSNNLTSFLMGIFFSAGWSPCVGPILGLILTFALNGGNIFLGGLYLLAFSMGLGIPFLIAATQIDWVTSILKKNGKLMKTIEFIMGIIMVLLGILLFLDKFATLSQVNLNFEVGDETIFGVKTLLITAGSFIFGLFPALFASNKGKSFINSWFLSAGLSFVLAFTFLFIGTIPSYLILAIYIVVALTIGILKRKKDK